MLQSDYGFHLLFRRSMASSCLQQRDAYPYMFHDPLSLSGAYGSPHHDRNTVGQVAAAAVAAAVAAQHHQHQQQQDSREALNSVNEGGSNGIDGPISSLNLHETSGPVAGECATSIRCC